MLFILSGCLAFVVFFQCLGVRRLRLEAATHADTEPQKEHNKECYPSEGLLHLWRTRNPSN